MVLLRKTGRPKEKRSLPLQENVKKGSRPSLNIFLAELELHWWALVLLEEYSKPNVQKQNDFG